MTDGLPRSSWRWDRQQDAVWTLWFDVLGRSHNVLEPAALDELDRCLAEAEGDLSVRGVLLRSAKPGGFCAGADLKTIQACQSPAELEAYLRHGSAVIERLAQFRVPTVAVLHGICLGGGLELALACRMRVAIASNISLQVGCPEVQRGLVPAWGGITRLTRLLAPRDALNLLLAGNPIGFLQAKSQGLVDRLVAQNETERLSEMIQLEPRPQRMTSPDTWLEELEFARAKILVDQPAEFPEAQDAIMEIIEIDQAQGREAATEAAIVRCAQLAFLPETRHSLDDFFNRRRGTA
jgi:enoyl-CoA hydratase/carnithine racemase